MLVAYNGKEYCCQIYEKDKLILRSMKKPDDTFTYYNGMYIKYVDKNECVSIVDNWIFAVYKGEFLYIYAANSSINEFYVVADSSTGYSEEFINVILDGKKGRDIFSWCSADIFTEFYNLRDNYFEHKDENKTYISKEQAMEYVILLNGGELVKKADV